MEGPFFDYQSLPILQNILDRGHEYIGELEMDGKWLEE
jgi:hypothetical protein